MSLARSTEFSRAGPFLLLAVTALILFFARDLLVPLAFALTLAFLLAPAVSRLETRRVPRVLAVAITGALAFTIIGGVGYVVARQLLNVARDLLAYRLSIQKKIASVHSPAGQSLEKAFTAVEDISRDLSISAGNAPPSVQQPLAQAQPVRVVDPDRTQFQSTVELLMRFLRPIGTFGVVIFSPSTS
jgi:predicted PurR-regulated permease PerM